METAAGFEIAKWFESEAGIVATVLGFFNVAQLCLGIYRDKRHKEICFELGQVWVTETKRWADRIDQMRSDTKEAFDRVEDLSQRGAEIREKIAVALAGFSATIQALTGQLEHLTRDLRDVTRTRNRE